MTVSTCERAQRRGTAELEVRLHVDPDPPAVGKAQLTVAVTDVSWRPLNGAHVTVSGTRMDGRGAPAEAVAVGRGAGQYLVPGFDFEATGGWTLTIRVELAGGQWTEVERIVTVEAP